MISSILLSPYSLFCFIYCWCLVASSSSSPITSSLYIEYVARDNGWRNISTLSTTNSACSVSLNYSNGTDEYPSPTSFFVVDKHLYAESPYCSIGRVFYKLNGVDYECSATVVHENLILTAGHCVYDGGNVSTEIKFVPGYYEGKMPYNEFWAYEAWAPVEWVMGHNFAFDFATVVLHPNQIGSVGNTVGCLNIKFNPTLQENRVWYSYGYPSLPPFDGQYNYVCLYNQEQRDKQFDPKPYRIECNSTDGASGGPWLSYDNTAKELYISSITSYKYIEDPNALYGPYLSHEAAALFLESSVVAPPYRTTPAITLRVHF